MSEVDALLWVFMQEATLQPEVVIWWLLLHSSKRSILIVCSSQSYGSGHFHFARQSIAAIPQLSYQPLDDGKALAAC